MHYHFFTVKKPNILSYIASKRNFVKTHVTITTIQQELVRGERNICDDKKNTKNSRKRIKVCVLFIDCLNHIHLMYTFCIVV